MLMFSSSFGSLLAPGWALATAACCRAAFTSTGVASGRCCNTNAQQPKAQVKQPRSVCLSDKIRKHQRGILPRGILQAGDTASFCSLRCVWLLPTCRYRAAAPAACAAATLVPFNVNSDSSPTQDALLVDSPAPPAIIVISL
jgi:hypothetical protein